MKQKTAIRQLIEQIDGYTKSYTANEALVKVLNVVIKEAQEFEHVNEQQIIDAYDTGHVDGDSIAWCYKDMEGKQYFNETFEKP